MRALNQRAVAITGASSGIGRECALRLGACGARVFAGVRSKEAAGDLAKAGLARGVPPGNLVPVLLDVTDQGSIRAAADSVREAVAGSGLAGLVGNAGISLPGPLELLPLEAFRRQVEVNLVGQVAFIQAFLPLIRAGGGRIVIVGSIAGRVALPFLGAYTATKSALAGLADSLAIELAQWQIPVSIVEPGNVSTGIWEKSRRFAEATIAEISPERWALYEDAASAFRRYTGWRGKTGMPPSRVAAAVERALTARRPSARYAVGLDSRLFGGLAPVLPGRLRRALIRRITLGR